MLTTLSARAYVSELKHKLDGTVQDSPLFMK